MRLPIKDKKRFVQKTLFWLNIFLLSLIVRLPFLSHISPDYTLFLEPWFRFFISEGYSVFKYDSFNYNVPYPYLLSFAATLLPSFPIIAIKSVSIIFDFILAFFVYKCVRLKYPESERIPAFAASIILFLPAVILNSAAWGQSDTIYTAFLVACLYALLRGQQGWAFIAFGLSISFKAQAIFLAPFLLSLLLKKQVKWRYFLLTPLIYLIIILPVWFIGRPLGELLSIYANQADRYSGLSFVPNLYQWVDYRHKELYPVGIILSAYFILVLTLLIYRSRAKMTATLLVQLATFFTLIMPFILPRMLERYFIPAGIISVIFAFYVPKYWYIPVIIGLSNFMVHIRYLYNFKLIPLKHLSILMLAAIVILGMKLLRTLEHLPQPSPRSIFLADARRAKDQADDDVAPPSSNPSA